MMYRIQFQVVRTLFLTVCCYSVGVCNTPIVPWSITVESPNRKYKLVLLSPYTEQQQSYSKRLRELWKAGGIPEENIDAARSALEKDLQREESIRKRYQVSGLYEVGREASPLWKTGLYDVGAWYVLADDSRHLIVGRYRVSGMKSESPISGNPNTNEIVGSHPDLTEKILAFYSDGTLLREYTGQELREIGFTLRGTANHEYIWGEPCVDPISDQTLCLLTDAGVNVKFDLMSGSRIGGVESNVRAPLPVNNDLSPSDLGSSVGLYLLALMGLGLLVIRANR